MTMLKPPPILSAPAVHPIRVSPEAVSRLEESRPLWVPSGMLAGTAAGVPPTAAPR